MYGLDVLGLAQFSKVAIREWPPGWACGVFANTFGNVWPALDKLLATGKCPRVRIHAVWDDNHQYRPAEHDGVINREVDRAIELQRKHSLVDVQFSPMCEHRIKGRQLQLLFGRLSSKIAGTTVRLVNSSYQGGLTPLAITEVHGMSHKPAGRYNYSWDGLSTLDSDIERVLHAYEDAETCYVWIPQCNGKAWLKDPTPRAQRKAWITAKQMRLLVGAVGT